MNDGRAAYVKARECLLALRSRVDELTNGIDPYPWGPISPVGKPGDHLTPNIRELALYRRADLIFFRAMLSGSLTGWFLDAGERLQVPGWAWADQDGNWRALLPESRFFHPLLPKPYRRWADRDLLVLKADFEEWIVSDDIMSERGFPKLPSAHDEASRSLLVTAEVPPSRPTVTLSEAVSWLAFGISLDADTLNAALNGHAFGQDDAATEAALAAAVEKLVTAATGGLRLIGKYVEAGMSHETALTEPIAPARFHDFRMFDVIRDGLRHGAGLTWTQLDAVGVSRQTPISKRSFYDVKLEREALLTLASGDAAALASAGSLDRAARRSGRRKGDGSMAGADAPFLAEMRKLIADGRAVSPNAAAFKVAAIAGGFGTLESKAARLGRRFREMEKNGGQ